MKGDGTRIDVAEKIDHTVPIKKCIHPGIFSCTFIYDRANLGGGEGNTALGRQIAALHYSTTK